jgi:hypothetical protein
MGLFGLTWSAALTVGPGLGLWTLSQSPAMLWISCGVLGIVAAWIISRKLRD